MEICYGVLGGFSMEMPSYYNKDSYKIYGGLMIVLSLN